MYYTRSHLKNVYLYKAQSELRDQCTFEGVSIETKVNGTF